MKRSLLICGNGIGMALDPGYFPLRAGLEAVWREPTLCSAALKRVLATAIPGVDDEHCPCSENQLDQLQMAIVASSFLRSFETEEVSWLSDESRELPVAFKRFIHAVAMYFHDYDEGLPDEFTSPLSDFIWNSKSHVALLNYDNLLYEAFKASEVLSGYGGPLIDGFLKSGFSSRNMQRHDAGRHGWYLHLHGSPLFVKNEKIMGKNRNFLDPTDESHIVLTHVQHKLSIINSSPILSHYWTCLRDAIEEVDNTILLGYSGEDNHLNEQLAMQHGKKTYIVEWAGNGNQQARIDFWAARLRSPDISVIQLDNILDFDAWDEFT